MRNKNISFWLFLTPVFISLGLVVIIPLLFGVFYSFTDWNGLGFNEFVGFDHYLNVLQEERFLNSLWFTIKFAIVTVIVLNILGLALALLVTKGLKSSNLLRTIFFMPNLIGGLILGFLWQFIFVNVFSSIGDWLGTEGLQGWLSTPGTGFWGLVILTSWQMAGYIMIIYIAYLQNIPSELIEASQVDGANAFQEFKNIIFPMVAPAFTVSMFLTLSTSFKIYDQNLALTNGGPFNSTEMVSLNIVFTAFTSNELALGQAKAVIFFLFVAIIAITQVYYTKKREVDL
ncbi:carbohydrate ABC transporter permease [Gracilibacillus phocaeensis]|uniref:carbohydrate ABC transporter permease n=1 Tax=Gracilibacillus phocaeensis TaxID=2042304 RepID=UPI0010302BD3|nr:sugar ABC transporter permease [Gracilibacillus phocaeensis]